MKTFEMTGSPENAGFSTKAVFVAAIEPYGFQHTTLTKSTNILVTDDPSSTTGKMAKAIKFGTEIMTYQEIKELFDLEGDC